jgi:3-oxoadipate enol-lactonase
MPRTLDSYLDAGGARLRYRDEGTGPVLVLVHGWTLDLDQWEPQAAELAADFRVVRLDRRGFGLSTGAPSTTTDVADLLALYAHLAIGSAALVGMSQGARVAFHFAQSHPQLISCLILDGPPHLDAAGAGSDGLTGRPTDLPYEYYRELARTKGLESFRREWSNHELTRLRTADRGAHSLLASMIARYPGRDLTGANEPVGAPAARNYARFDRPSVVISGEFDLDSRRQFARHIALQLPRSEFVEIPGAGHLSNLDNPRAYNEALRQFSQRHAGLPPAMRSVL